MSSGEVRKVSCQEVQLVQNLIERCIQLYMTQNEAENTLLHHAKIEPVFTELVWQKLEEENQEFFRGYNLRLILKDQILRFNELLERQKDLMRQMSPSEVTSISLTNGSQTPSGSQNSSVHPPEYNDPALNPEKMQPPSSTNVSNQYTNGLSSLQTAVNMPAAHSRVIDAPSNTLLCQTPNIGMIGLNQGMIRSEAGYQGHTSFMFGSDNNALDARPTIADSSLPPCCRAESNSQPPNDSILDAHATYFGLLGQIPRTFSLSDLTTDFPLGCGSHFSANIVPDTARNCSGSPYLITDGDNFLDPHGREEQQDWFL